LITDRFTASKHPTTRDRAGVIHQRAQMGISQRCIHRQQWHSLARQGARHHFPVGKMRTNEERLPLSAPMRIEAAMIDDLQSGNGACARDLTAIERLYLTSAAFAQTPGPASLQPLHWLD